MWWQRLLWWRPPCLVRRVIVNLVHEETEAIEGVLWRYRGGWCVLRECSALKAGQPPKAMVGEVVIHRDRIAYFQVEAPA
jgi:hypothetical protein